MISYRASNLIGQTLARLKQAEPVDKLLHLLINADNGVILALIGRREVLAPEKINASPLPAKLIGRLPKNEEKENINLALKHRQFVLKSRVETESGHYLGRVLDFEFDDISWKIKKIYISDKIFLRALAQQLQIPHEDILFIGKDKVIVRDGLIKREISAQATQPDSRYARADSGATLSEKS